MGFKENFGESERANESKKIIFKYPSRIPIIVERYKDCSLNEINKNKYLVPKDLTMGQFVGIIRKRINLDPAQALFIMINNKLVPNVESMGTIYENEKNIDGFLYLVYTSENTFG